MHRPRLRVLAPAAVLAVLLPLPGAQAQDPATYTAPFTVGPHGGDSFSTHRAEPDGRVVVGRAYPVPAVISCGSGAPYANLRITHSATRPVTEVQVDYVEAAVEPYTFLSVGVHGGDGWIGNRKARGPHAGSGTVTVPVTWPEGATVFPREVLVDVGLEASGACPSLNGGTVRITAVRVL